MTHDISIDTKQDEKDLFNLIKKEGIYMREAGELLGIAPKRIEYIANKWSHKGFYQWGVVHDKGWFN